MATKRHRLLHSLVFSSVLAAGGCGAASPAPLEPAPLAQNTYAETSAPRSEAGVYAESSEGAVSSEGAGATEEPAVSRRYCEPGWPTTKGSTCEETVNDEGETETVCCGGSVPPGGDPADPESGCCVQAS